ncbi:hypothetical protein JCM11641_006439 [Rhodosporidiobolus odoratus]
MLHTVKYFAPAPSAIERRSARLVRHDARRSFPLFAQLASQFSSLVFSFRIRKPSQTEISSAPLELLNKLRTDDIIPSIVQEKFVGEIKGSVKAHFREATACRGEAIPRSATLDEPVIEFQEARADASYTLICIDPEFLKHNDTFSGQVRHWIQIRPPFTFAFSDAVALFCLPVPDPPHAPVGRKQRYIFIVVKEPVAYTPSQDKNFPKQDPADLKDRMQFNVATGALPANLAVIRSASEERVLMSISWMTVAGVGRMEVDADAAAMKDNLALAAEAIKNKVLGQ